MGFLDKFKEVAKENFNAAMEETKSKVAMSKKKFSSNVISYNQQDKEICFNKSKVYQFSDVISFEIIDNDNIVSQGAFRTMATTMTLGFVGRKTEGVCNSLYINVTVNDLKKPLVKLPFITKKVKKSSKDYRNAIEESEKAIALLTLLLNNNND